eukprot:1194038-Amphidinium_carterae.1
MLRHEFSALASPAVTKGVSKTGVPRCPIISFALVSRSGCADCCFASAVHVARHLSMQPTARRQPLGLVGLAVSALVHTGDEQDVG